MWKEKLKGIVVGLLIGLTMTGVMASAATTLNNVSTGVKIVVDGQELIPTDAQGNRVEPFIYKGTTYLPVRAVASAVGKSVYWDGPSRTVYLGEMGGRLEYPTAMLKDLKSIAGDAEETDRLTDNYGNRYNSAVYSPDVSSSKWEYLLDMRYSRFKATLYVPEGVTGESKVYLTISTDGKVVYTSPDMTASSYPVDIDIDVRGCNDFVIEWSDGGWYSNYLRCLADAGFYQ